MAQTKIVRGIETSVFTDETGDTRIIYRGTPVVIFNDHSIVLRDRGWRTATTKLRMNQASNQFGLGYQVYQDDFAWYVWFPATDPDCKKPIPYTDGMELRR